MENATKALMIAASVLIAVMLFSFMALMFRRFSTTAKNTEERMAQNEVEAFNSKFTVYDTNGADSVTLTHVSRTIGSRANLIEYKYSQILNSGLSNKKDYYKALVDISNSLNTPVDLVTAINDAIDINYQNNNGYIYNDGKIEIQNSVEIIVDLGDNLFNFSRVSPTSDSHYKYMLIEPNKSVKAKHIYATNSLASTKTERANTFSTASSVSVYDILTELRETKMIPPAVDMAESELDRQYTVYKYYFKCDINFNELTDLVETLKFTLVEDKNF